MEHLYWFLLLALVAEILGTVGGFGSSMFFVPIAGMFLDFHSVLGVTALFHLSSNVSKIVLFRHGFDKQLIWSMGVPAVIFVIAGAYISKFVDAYTLELSIAVFLILASIAFFIFTRLSLRPTQFNSVLGGSLSGLVAGLLGTGGAIRGITLAAFDLKMEVFIATSAIIDLAIDLSRSVVYTANGFVHKDDLYLVPLLVAVGFIGTYLGKKILRYVSEERFKKIVLVLTLGTGVFTLLRMLF